MFSLNCFSFLSPKKEIKREIIFQILKSSKWLHLGGYPSTSLHHDSSGVSLLFW